MLQRIVEDFLPCHSYFLERRLDLLTGFEATGISTSDFKVCTKLEGL